MTYIIIPQVERDFVWNLIKSDRNRLERGLPFDFAVMLFDRPTLERPDTRLDYREVRMQADRYDRPPRIDMRLYGPRVGAADYQSAPGQQERT